MTLNIRLCSCFDITSFFVWNLVKPQSFTYIYGKNQSFTYIYGKKRLKAKLLHILQQNEVTYFKYITY